MSDVILRITTQKAWSEVQRRIYVTESLKAEGFIHFSTPAQVVEVANFVYFRQENLVLLCVLPERLSSELKYKALSTDEPYPHLYGPLNLTVVIRVIDFPPHADGTFELPEELTAIRFPRDA